MLSTITWEPGSHLKSKALISRVYLSIILPGLITTDITLGAAANSLSPPQCHLSGMDPPGENPMLAEVFLLNWSKIKFPFHKPHSQPQQCKPQIWPQISTQKHVSAKLRGSSHANTHVIENKLWPSSHIWCQPASSKDRLILRWDQMMLWSFN